MGEHGFNLIATHLLQQTTADRDQRTIASGTGRKRVHLGRVVDGNFRHADTGPFGLAAHCREQPGFSRIRRILEDPGTGLPFRDPFRHGQ